MDASTASAYRLTIRMHPLPMNKQTFPIRNCFLIAVTRRLALLFAALGLCVRGMEARAEAEATEYDLKAAFLCNFVQFVKWSGGASSTVGILGDDPFEGKLQKALRGKLGIKRSRRPEDLKTCQIVFVSKSERGNVGAILSSLEGTNVLTVGDMDGFAKQGGVIGFTMDGDKVRFEINEGAARRAGLELSSRLLKLASRIYKS